MNTPDDPQLPPALADELRRRDPRLPDAPPAVDDAVLAAARRHFNAQAPTHRRAPWRLYAGALGAAAALGLVVWVRQAPTADVAAPPPAAGLARDFNHDGRVDILDALALARRLEAPGATPRAIPGADVNHDGRADRADVEALARSVVRLTAPGDAT